MGMKRLRRYANPKATMIFLAIAVGLMVLLDVFIISPERYKGYQGNIMSPSVFDDIGSEVDDFTTALDVQKKLQGPKGLETAKSLEAVPEEAQEETPALPEQERKAEPTAPAAEKRPAPQVAITPATHGKPRIAIIIDDMGLNAPRTNEVIKLPKTLTLAYLPYAPHLDQKTRDAKSYGHELMIHVPMQPMKDSMDAGPNVLTVDMSKRDLNKALKGVFKSFDGYAGINNHMGSKLTQDREKMSMIMEQLKERNLYFIDSKTIPNSVAAEMAREAGVAYNSRDVFLDHVPTYEFSVAALKQTEDIARKRGSAIAIGHPKENTIKALEEWIPTLKEKGIELVPVSEILKRPIQSN